MRPPSADIRYALRFLYQLHTKPIKKMLRQIAELALAVLCATALIAGSAVFCIEYAMPHRRGSPAEF
jgi:hypothetical protein